MNFNEYIDRNLYPTMKWSKSFLSNFFGNENALPMSVADMDMRAPQAVIDHLDQRVRHGIFGYEERRDSFYQALETWYQKRHAWNISRDHLEQSPSLLNAVAILIEQHSQKNQGVIIQPPVFFEFRMVIRSNHRKIIKNPLILTDSQYQMDFEDLERKAADPDNKILILCNPHNPIGRVWTEAELSHVAEICTRHDVLVISDEIHGDFCFYPHRYTPFMTLSPGNQVHAAACISPGKTFNISGLVDAFAVIPNRQDRDTFHDFSHRFQTNKVNVLSSLAMEIAYREGGAWLDALLEYLKGNISLIREYLQENIPSIRLIEPEGTFMVWLDFRALGFDAKVLEKFLSQDAGLALSPGYWFGREGAGFARMTIGCPRATIEKALDNLTQAVAAIDPGRISE